MVGFLVVGTGGETMQWWFMAWLWGEWVKGVQRWPDWDVRNHGWGVEMWFR